MENKRPLVCIHGFLESREMWKQLPLEALGRPLIFPEIPGHGARKEESAQAYTISQVAESIVQEIRQQGITAYDVIGHSMGGYIGLEMAAIPGFDGRLILLNSTYKADSEAKKQDRLRVSKLVLKDKRHFVREAIPGLFADPHAHDVFIRELIREASLMHGAWIAEAALAMRERRDNLQTVRELGNRCAFILGEFDRAVPPETIVEDQALFPEAELHLLEDSGHMSYVECRDAVMNILSAQESEIG